MRLDYLNGVFYLTGKSSSEAIIEKFDYNRQSDVIYTKNQFLAYKYFTSATPAAKQALSDIHARVQRSYATTTSYRAPVKSPSFIYFPYQQAGIEFINTTKNVLLADEMGLGKTHQIIGHINAADYRGKQILVVVPRTLIHYWYTEIVQNSIHPLSVSVWSASKQETSNVIVVSYDQVHRVDVTAIDLLVLDEAHYIMNRNSVRSKRLEPYCVLAKKKVFSTGTPLLNRPMDLYNVLRLLDNTLMPSYKEFAYKYCDGREKNGFFMDKGESNLDELQIMLRSSVMIRRFTKEVLPQLPSEQRNYILLDRSVLSAKQKKEDVAFTKLVHSASGDIDELSVPSHMQFNMAALRKEIAMAKVPLSVEYIKSLLEEQEKVLVFAHHSSVLDALQDALMEYGVERIDGQTSSAGRTKAIQSFQQGSTRILLASILAANAGYTVTASHCTVFVENSWVWNINRQAEKRTNRIGQQYPTQYHYLVVNDSVEAHMTNVCLRKMKVEEEALNKKVG